MATSSQSWEERALGRLRSGGRRAGGARDAVVGVLARQDCAISAQQAADILDEAGREVGIASVYRALETLTSLGLVRRLELGDGVARFEPVHAGGDHHHHAVCDTCGEVTPFDDAGLEADMSRVERALPLEVSFHEVVIHGTCTDCSDPVAS
ncbi:MAG: Fur family transcriptional regulator [Solirubrobacterales bacterium]